MNENFESHVAVLIAVFSAPRTPVPRFLGIFSRVRMEESLCPLLPHPHLQLWNLRACSIRG